MKVYLDNASTTPLDPRVRKAMVPWLSKRGNTMSLHYLGQESRKVIEAAREKVSRLVNCYPEEIVFTSGATESNNTALKGIAWSRRNKGKHILVSSIEHPSVLKPVEWLVGQGFDAEYIPVDNGGVVKLDVLEEKIRKDTILVSVMHANNEIGTIQPIEQIGRLCKERGVCFHTDAAQTLGTLKIDLEKSNVDLMSVSAHKLYGPQGVGFLYIRHGTGLEPLLHGGGQENGMRSSTVNVSGVVGFGEACLIASKEMGREQKISILRDRLIRFVSKIPGSELTGHPKQRLPGNAHFTFPNVDGKSLVLKLSERGIAASTGSACSSSNKGPSHVLVSLGMPRERINGGLRLTLGKFNKPSEIDYVVGKLKEILH